ncbi:P-loop containing nucleoside triphosphate hydrolase protein [Schizophyllum commune H4-8]|uniref:P-loop containing nucleoside triphosphate hydrolase protein n=1 Tax=Schizophyllum commune (strain H4-8 / FGSC 9210) TaxID=578458 RepID=UPI00215FBCD2|nr:P-loop containing nucleoside triphosphate hydrolase protein [Schizophyllum commune H4-8]KAI5891724.1 P-loop containing nucleoside triphosphate hydrolase protein [Schizophyllum commune H4-8]
MSAKSKIARQGRGARAEKPSATSSVGTNASTPQITATSQTSRFHVDTLSTLAKEIDLKDVNITVGDHEILVDAHLRLKESVHYGLVGRNGEGKTTLLRAIADKVIPGIPENLRILLAGQVESALGEINGKVDELTVLQVVVKSDRKREAALKEYTILESVATPEDAGRAIAEVNLERARAQLTVARKVADRRSGARGAEARKVLLAAEAGFKEAEGRVISPARDADTLVVAHAMLEEVKDALYALGSDSTEAKARKILLGLGFRADQLDAPFTTLSGGWRSRCSLASVLLQEPDILILDEPTNYLDIPAIIWLQKHIVSLDETTVIIVAHDRAFLDEATEETIFLRSKALTYFEGSISAAQRAIAKKRKGAIRARDALEKKRIAVEKSIAHGAKIARETGDENKARMVKARQKKLDERWGAEVNEKGHRFKLNRDMQGFHTARRADIVVDSLDPAITLPFINPEPLRFPGSLCSLSNVSFRYGPRLPYVLKAVTLTVHPGDRIGLVGKNGEGKSTLVKLLVGELQPTRGEVTRHPRLTLGYYSQHSVEQLSRPEMGQKSALRYFMEEMRAAHNIDVDEQTSRAFLGSFGLHGKTATISVGMLSGGQKVRLALALLVYPAPHLLVLDEVSTHLDMDTTAALIKALRAFKGAVVLVSHDRHLVHCVVEGGRILPKDEGDSDASDEEEEAEPPPGGVYRVGPRGEVKRLRGSITEVRTSYLFGLSNIVLIFDFTVHWEKCLKCCRPSAIHLFTLYRLVLMWSPYMRIMKYNVANSHEQEMVYVWGNGDTRQRTTSVKLVVPREGQKSTPDGNRTRAACLLISEFESRLNGRQA